MLILLAFSLATIGLLVITLQTDTTLSGTTKTNIQNTLYLNAALSGLAIAIVGYEFGKLFGVSSSIASSPSSMLQKM